MQDKSPSPNPNLNSDWIENWVPSGCMGSVSWRPFRVWAEELADQVLGEMDREGGVNAEVLAYRNQVQNKNLNQMVVRIDV